MKTIWKVSLKLLNQQMINVPHSAKILSAKEQRGELCLWAEVDSDNRPNARMIAIYGTGNPIPDCIKNPGKFIDTVVMEPFVWHVYEIEELV